MSDGQQPPRARFLPIGIGVGVAIGACLGIVTDQIGLWLPMGLAAGSGLGAALSAEKRP